MPPENHGLVHMVGTGYLIFAKWDESTTGDSSFRTPNSALFWPSACLSESPTSQHSLQVLGPLECQQVLSHLHWAIGPTDVTEGITTLRGVAQFGEWPYDTSINHENLVIQWIIISHHRIHPPIYHTLQIMTDQPAAMKSRGAAWIWDKSSKDESMAKWRLNSWVYHFRIMYHSIHIIYYIYISIYSHTVSRNI